MESDSQRLLELRNRMEALLCRIEGAKINSRKENRLPNTTNISLNNIDGNQLLRRLNMLAVSRGSACSANTVQPSHVLLAMGLAEEQALSSLRISIGKQTELEDIEFAVSEIEKTVEQLKTANV